MYITIASYSLPHRMMKTCSLQSGYFKDKNRETIGEIYLTVYNVAFTERLTSLPYTLYLTLKFHTYAYRSSLLSFGSRFPARSIFTLVQDDGTF